jgi:hypothetical protein
MLRRATHVRSGNCLARSRGVKLHVTDTPSRLVPFFVLRFQRVSEGPPWSEVANGVGIVATATLRDHVRPCSPKSSGANKPKALSAATTVELGTKTRSECRAAFGVCQNYALPEQVASLEGAEWRSLSSTVTGWRRRHTNCRPMARLPKIAPPGANRRQAATLRDGQRQKAAERDRGRQETPTSVNWRRLRCCSGETHSYGSARRTLSARATFSGAKPITLM